MEGCTSKLIKRSNEFSLLFHTLYPADQQCVIYHSVCLTFYLTGLLKLCHSNIVHFYADVHL